MFSLWQRLIRPLISVERLHLVVCCRTEREEIAAIADAISPPLVCQKVFKYGIDVCVLPRVIQSHTELSDFVCVCPAKEELRGVHHQFDRQQRESSRVGTAVQLIW